MNSLIRHILPVLLLVSTCAAYGMNLEQYEKLRRARAGSEDYALLRFYVGALGEAMELYSAGLERKQQKPLYCSPSNLPLNAENYLESLDKSIAKYRSAFASSATPISMILLLALQEQFPCAKS